MMHEAENMENAEYEDEIEYKVKKSLEGAKAGKGEDFYADLIAGMNGDECENILEPLFYIWKGLQDLPEGTTAREASELALAAWKEILDAEERRFQQNRRNK